MTYVLDTTLVSALMRAEPKPSARLLQAAPDEVSIPQPVAGEVRYGLARLPSSRRRRELEERFEILLRTLARASWTDEVSRSFGRIKADLERRGQPIGDFDAAIAAHALAVDGVVVTRNVRHFERIRGLDVEDWT
ncbi:MAG: PIN domain-containing protein [Polyangiaceae bacterium]